MYNVAPGIPFDITAIKELGMLEKLGQGLTLDDVLVQMHDNTTEETGVFVFRVVYETVSPPEEAFFKLIRDQFTGYI